MYDVCSWMELRSISCYNYQCITLSTAATSSTYRCSPELGFVPMSRSCSVAANRSSSLAGTPQPGHAIVPSLTKEQAGSCEQAVEPLLGAFSCKVQTSMTLASLGGDQDTNLGSQEARRTFIVCSTAEARMRSTISREQHLWCLGHLGFGA